MLKLEIRLTWWMSMMLNHCDLNDYALVWFLVMASIVMLGMVIMGIRVFWWNDRG